MESVTIQKHYWLALRAILFTFTMFFCIGIVLDDNVPHSVSLGQSLRQGLYDSALRLIKSLRLDAIR